MRKAILCLAVLSLFSVSETYAAQSYSYTSIEYPGAVSTSVSGINNLGHVAGSYDDGTATHGFLFDGKKYTKIDYPGAPNSVLRNLNDSDNVVGVYSYNETNGFPVTYGFTYDKKKYASISFPSDPQFGQPVETSANGINNKGTVAGGYWVGGGVGYTYEQGKFTFINGGMYILDINNQGTMLGYEPDAYYSMLYDGKNWFSLNGLPQGYFEFYANGLNDKGYVVGEFNPYDYFNYTYFLYDGKGFSSLDGLIPGTPFDINGSGQTAGTWFNGTTWAGFIATPGHKVPEPSSTLLLSMALGGVFLLKKKVS